MKDNHVACVRRILHAVLRRHRHQQHYCHHCVFVAVIVIVIIVSSSSSRFGRLADSRSGDLMHRASWSSIQCRTCMYLLWFTGILDKRVRLLALISSRVPVAKSRSCRQYKNCPISLSFIQRLSVSDMKPCLLEYIGRSLNQRECFNVVAALRVNAEGLNELYKMG